MGLVGSWRPVVRERLFVRADSRAHLRGYRDVSQFERKVPNQRHNVRPAPGRCARIGPSAPAEPGLRPFRLAVAAALAPAGCGGGSSWLGGVVAYRAEHALQLVAAEGAGNTLVDGAVEGALDGGPERLVGELAGGERHVFP